MKNLKDSINTSDKLSKNSLQMWNLLRVLNKDITLDGLQSIEEVYDSHVNIIEEITYYHNLKGKIGKKDLNMSLSSSNSEQIAAMNDSGGPVIFKNIKNIYNQDNKDDSVDSSS